VENWKGTTLSFILHYQEQIWLYDQLQPPNEQTSDHAKMIYLQNAVYAIEELRSVQTTGSQIALAIAQSLHTRITRLSLNWQHLLTIELTHQ
jgi:hypothetical protein